MAERYSKLGNFEYKHEHRIAHSLGLVETPELIIKYYGMCKQDDGVFKDKEINDYKEIMGDMINKGTIKPLSGLGFAIYSGDFLNVAVWDNEKPYVLKNQIFEPDEEGTICIMDSKKGAFCAFELGIVNYEKNLWLNYLQSERKTLDKMSYLNKQLEGIVSR
jgi:hypothetical protein